jgi:phenylacetate-coenzyme A ligase PaaK-like adenylate-forming protein
MHPRYEATRLIDITRSMRLAARSAERERWPREQLARFQQERLEALVAHARAHSPYYRERIGGSQRERPGGPPAALSALPVMDKATLMERFDDIVTDRRLRRDDLLAHLERIEGDDLLFGRYRAMTTSGSSGRKGLFVYDRPGWVAIGAAFMRFSAWAGTRPKLPRRRMAYIGGGSPTHMSRRGSAMLSIGLHKMLAVPVTTPVPSMVEALNAFGPDCLHVYPSMAVLLADEKRAGRLRAAPAVVTTSSELCTPEMAEAIEDAFGVRPLDLYASTEGLWGAACGEGPGHHLFEDLAIVENVDDGGHTVPDGERGARVLVTNLANFVQPLIRFEVSDIVTLDPEPCPCGRTLRRMRAVDGRADAVLRLPAASGARVPVHPLQFGVITADRGVREFQVLQRGDGVHVRVVVREGQPPAEVAERLRERVGERLAALGVRAPHVAVEPCAALERPPAGKLQLVVAEGEVGAPA